MRTIMLFVFLALTPPVGAAANTVEQEAERLLEAVGGRDVGEIARRIESDTKADMVVATLGRKGRYHGKRSRKD